MKFNIKSLLIKSFLIKVTMMAMPPRRPRGDPTCRTRVTTRHLTHVTPGPIINIAASPDNTGLECLCSEICSYQLES